MRPLLTATLLMCTTLAIDAAQLPEGTQVRADSMAFEPGWHPGVVKRSEGCTMVHYPKPLAGGYTSSALIALDKLQVAKDGGWVEVDLQALLNDEPEQCREDMAD